MDSIHLPSRYKISLLPILYRMTHEGRILDWIWATWVLRPEERRSDRDSQADNQAA